MTDARTTWIRAGVGLSIALNLFLVGFVGAHLLPFGTPATQSAAITGDTEPGAPLREAIRQVIERLPTGDARLLREAFAARLPELGTLQRQARQAAERVRQDIGQPTLDTAKLRADLTALHDARQKIRPVIDDILLDALPRLSPQGREILSQARLRPRRPN